MAAYIGDTAPSVGYIIGVKTLKKHGNEEIEDQVTASLRVPSTVPIYVYRRTLRYNIAKAGDMLTVERASSYHGTPSNENLMAAIVRHAIQDLYTI